MLTTTRFARPRGRTAQPSTAEHTRPAQNTVPGNTQRSAARASKGQHGNPGKAWENKGKPQNIKDCTLTMARFARPHGAQHSIAQHSAREPSKALCQRTPREAKQGTARKPKKRMGNQSHRTLRVASLRGRSATQQGMSDQQSTPFQTFPKTVAKPSQNHAKILPKPSKNHSKTIPRGFMGRFPRLSSKWGPYRPLSDSPGVPKIARNWFQNPKKNCKKSLRETM